MLRSGLRLVRAPNTLTCAADVIAGAAVATGGHLAPVPVIGAALGCMLAYAFGMGLNDLVDREKDSRLHPERPLPSGELSVAAAKGITGACAALSLLVLAATGLKLGLIGAALLIAVVGYDVVLKQSPLATLAMGICRGLSLTLGIVAGGGLGGDILGSWAPTAWPEVVMPAVHVALIVLVTLVSLHEERPISTAGRVLLLAGLALCYASPIALGCWPIPVALGAALLAAYVVRPGLQRAKATASSISGEEPRLGLVVRNAIFTLVLYDGLMALGAGSWVMAAACAILYPLIRTTAAWLRQKGS